MGYFVDFDMNSPPQKAENEFRIILIGGSGAQGWGGTINENMFYRLLEKRLNELFNKEDIFIRIINMAMAGSMTYQNFVELNKFGHALYPDMIISYSGRNDYGMPLFYDALPDAYVYFDIQNAINIALRPYEYPPQLKPLVQAFPNIFSTRLGLVIKYAYDMDYFRMRAREIYSNSRGLHYHDKRIYFNEYVIPFYIDALKSIKRDFEGIPIMLAWQAVGKPEEDELAKVLGKGWNDFMYDSAKKELSAYINKDWYFINVHAMTRHVKGIGMHLNDRQHELVTDILASQLIPVIKEHLEKRKSHKTGCSAR